ncbi:TetR family transcriptional regulator [Fructobacillus sp. M2-14]|uniref:TetR family transcriptional regulator n=1 Tax=Fructobacillus broussonetiae TaxID=2713173 RepID=A0ABS5R179_9LACO|nr:TetR family transcriptional regulator [Fructobacillus broussonetiae]MBS9339116.1 TetR family transcriptional regulator [Fructobacillus broussonetiae]
MAERMTKDKIVDVALDMLAKDGLAGLSMRKLADVLGIKAATLYWHIPNKGALLEEMANRVIEESLSSFAKDGDWKSRLKQNAQALSEKVRQHPYSVELLNVIPPHTRSYLKLTNELLSVVEPLPLSDQEKLYAILLIQDYVQTFEKDYLRQSTEQYDEGAIDRFAEFDILARMSKEGILGKMGSKDMLNWALSSITDGIEKKIEEDDK